MANINLLPWREERREELQREFLTVTGLVAILAIGFVMLVHQYYTGAVDDQGARNSYLEKNIAELTLQVKEIEELKKKRAQLLDRMKVIQDLQGNRPVIVRVFDELTRTLPQGVYYTELNYKNNLIKIKGTAESNNRVSSLMRALDASEWFVNPNLTGVKANAGAGENANDFDMSVSLATPSDKEEQ